MTLPGKVIPIIVEPLRLPRPAREPSRRAHHLGPAMLVLRAARPPLDSCKLQILNVGAGGTIERCLPASPSHH
jgi:hypothetical protein